MKTLTHILFIFPFFVILSCNNHSQKADAYGNFESNEIMVSTEASGRLIHLGINEGDRIDSGQIIGFVDTLLLSLQKEQLIAKINTVMSQRTNLLAQEQVLKVQLINTQREINRVDQLLKDGAVATKQLDDLNAAADVIKMQVKALETQQNSVKNEVSVLEIQVKQMEEQIHRAKVISPSSGTVLVKYVEEGEIVAPGKPLFKLGNLESLILRAYVSGVQLTEIRIGEEVGIKVDISGGEQRTFHGVVEWISANAEFTPKIVQTREERVNLVYAVKVRVKNDGSLKIGMPGELYFQ